MNMKKREFESNGLRVRSEIVRGSGNAKARTVEICLSSEEPVDRGDYIEVLDHSPGSVDLTRLNNRHPLLVNHDLDDQVGVIERAWLDDDRRCRCLVRFGKSERANEILQDILDEVRPHCSVGYQHTAQLNSDFDEDAGKHVIRFAWAPYEVSTVSIPADQTVGVGRSAGNEPPAIKGVSNEEFEARLNELRENRYMNDTVATTKLFGLKAGDVRRFSIARAIRDVIEGRGPTGFEREMLEEGRKQFGASVQGQIFVPPDVMVGVNRRDPLFRDLNVTTASQGGNFVQTTVLTPIIEILRNKMVTQRAGVQMLGGLQGNIAIPRQTGAATAYTVAEQGLLTKSTQSINQVPMTPHRVGAWTSYSKQLLLQSSVDIESFLRDDLVNILALKMDAFVLKGNGGSEPLGVRNTSGIGAVTFGGAATWAKTIEFETSLALANADTGRISFIVNPNVRAKWKTIPKLAASVVPIYLWEQSLKFPNADGEVNGYQAFSTNQVDDTTIAFGNWEDDIFGMWGGIDLVVDGYTNAATATVNIVVNAYVDNAVRHPQSFAWSTDSATQ
jgi:HK97 family phage major capsid protein